METHGGIWKFDENKLHQKEADGQKFVTGLRQEPAITWHDGALYIVMNSRDQLDVLWAGKFTAKENAERPAETMYRATQGLNFGWPYCFFDYGLQKLLLNPEYGGDGKIVGRCSQYALPIASYPAHWAPVDVMFYSGSQFPARYKGCLLYTSHSHLLDLRHGAVECGDGVAMRVKLRVTHLGRDPLLELLRDEVFQALRLLMYFVPGVPKNIMEKRFHQAVMTHNLPRPQLSRIGQVHAVVLLVAD